LTAGSYFLAVVTRPADLSLSAYSSYWLTTADTS